MARGNRKIRYVSEISTIRELREVRRDVDMKLWYAEDRISEDIAETFSLDNLISIVAPPGSVADRIAGGIDMGLATVRGTINAINLFRSRRRSRRY